MPDQGDAVEGERLQDIVIMQRKVVYVADPVELSEIGKAGRQRRHHRVALRKFSDDRVMATDAVRTVQPHDRRPLPRTEHLADPTIGMLDAFTCQHARYSAAILTGAGRCTSTSAFGHQRSSCSLKRLRSFGITSRANRAVL